MLGSARASRAGDDALVIANFFPNESISARRRNQHARARALPRGRVTDGLGVSQLG